MTRPIPAKGKFPYPHRTVAEVDAEIDRAHLAAILAAFTQPRRAILKSLGRR